MWEVRGVGRVRVWVCIRGRYGVYYFCNCSLLVGCRLGRRVWVYLGVDVYFKEDYLSYRCWVVWFLV